MILSYWKALRPHQWTKNIIIFTAPIFAWSLSKESILGSLIAFSLFCLTSSSFYLFNDIADVEVDRLHPVKCKRPIASGQVKISIAMIMAFTLGGFSLVCSYFWNPLLSLILILYSLLQVGYNLKLKHTVIADIITIAIGFVLRALAGASATNTPVSPWFLVCTAMLALFLGVEKRKAELRNVFIKGKSKTTRKVLQRYSLPLLSRMENVVTTGTIITYALWSAGPKLGGASSPWMLVTLPLVLYGVFRYQLLSDPKEIARRKRDNDSHHIHTERPEDVLLNDRAVQLTLISWFISVAIILSLHHS